MLMTDVDGLYTGPPTDPSSEIIPTYCPQVHDPLIKFGIKSDGGRGGMIAKVRRLKASNAVGRAMDCCKASPKLSSRRRLGFQPGFSAVALARRLKLALRSSSRWMPHGKRLRAASRCSSHLARAATAFYRLSPVSQQCK